jgi:hypothetical protein
MSTNPLQDDPHRPNGRAPGTLEPGDPVPDDHHERSTRATADGSAGTTYCQYHCSKCGAHFTSLAGFAAHRRGSHAENTRYCADPATVRGSASMSAVTGTCRIADGRDHPIHEAAVWVSDRTLETRERVALAREAAREGD